ncbi:hypothetical protein AcW1_003874 [Taiwanofungus camphoratus]|nr:hypothetical protein AcW1_003874 [Antrodia cinnamomea]
MGRAKYRCVVVSSSASGDHKLPAFRARPACFFLPITLLRIYALLVRRTESNAAVLLLPLLDVSSTPARQDAIRGYAHFLYRTTSTPRLPHTSDAPLRLGRGAAAASHHLCRLPDEALNASIGLGGVLPLWRTPTDSPTFGPMSIQSLLCGVDPVLLLPVAPR